jgi:hypothetical protein
MSLIKGENIILFIYSDTIWKPVVCGRDCSFNTNAESIETSITGSGAWRTYEYKALTWTCSFDGVILLDGLNQLSLQDIRALQYSRQKVLIRYQREDQDSNVYTDEGYGLVTSISDSGNYQDLGTFTIEILGSGPLTSVITPTPIDPAKAVKRYEYTASGGETYFEDSELEDKVVLDIVCDGIGRSNIILSGTPVGQEVKYDATSGKIEFPFGLEADTEVYVLYQDL